MLRLTLVSNLGLPPVKARVDWPEFHSTARAKHGHTGVTEPKPFILPLHAKRRQHCGGRGQNEDMFSLWTVLAVKTKHG